MRELNPDTAGVLARVERGETVEITASPIAAEAGELLRRLRDEERY